MDDSLSAKADRMIHFHNRFKNKIEDVDQQISDIYWFLFSPEEKTNVDVAAKLVAQTSINKILVLRDLVLAKEKTKTYLRLKVCLDANGVDINKITVTK